LVFRVVNDPEPGHRTIVFLSVVDTMLGRQNHRRASTDDRHGGPDMPV
jgi:hypothetical protein